jgi:hypothetical protein
MPDSFLNDTELEIGVWFGHRFIIAAAKVFGSRESEKGVGLDS